MGRGGGRFGLTDRVRLVDDSGIVHGGLMRSSFVIGCVVVALAGSDRVPGSVHSPDPITISRSMKRVASA